MPDLQEMWTGDRLPFFNIITDMFLLLLEVWFPRYMGWDIIYTFLFKEHLFQVRKYTNY